MKKVYVILMTAIVSFAIMSFRTSSEFENSMVASKMETNNKSKLTAKLNDSKAITTVVVVAVDQTLVMELDSPVMVVVTTTNGDDFEFSKNYQPILQNIDMRKLDKRN